MSLSPAEAGKQVGLTKQSIIKAIRSGRLSAEKDANGGWCIEPVELFRVWPPVTQVSGNDGVKVDASTPPESPEVVALLKAQIDDLRADRDHWRDMAERLALTDQRPRSPATDVEPGSPSRSSFWGRLLGK